MRALSRWWLLVWLLALCSAAQAYARDEATGSAAPRPLPCELVVRAENASFPAAPRAADGVLQVHPGASLLLRFDLTWTGDAPVLLYWGKGANDSPIKLTIKTPSGAMRGTSPIVAPLKPERGRPERFVTLKPGELASCQFAIGAWRDGPQFFRFGEPGRHELTATFELHVAKGNPLLAESWQALGRVEAAAVPFGVVSHDGADRDVRLIRGRVIDAAGAAVPRADVYVHVERENVGSIDLHREFVAFDRAVTDDEGAFTFPGIPAREPRLMVSVLHEEFPTLQSIVAPDAGVTEQELELPLGRARVISGTVVDDQGRPLSGVSVLRPAAPGVRRFGSARTDQDGRFELRGVTSDATLIEVNAQGWAVSGDSNVLPAGEAATTLSVVMLPRTEEPRPTLSGRTRFENGQPARDMQLEFWVELPSGDLRHCETATDGTGRFRVQLSSEFANQTGPFVGIAELSREETSEPQERWMARLAIPSAAEDFELEFRREHTVRVNLTSAVPLPAALDVRVMLSARPSHGGSAIVKETRRGNDLSPVTVRHLTPGRYQVQVDLAGVSHFTAYEDVTIAFDAAAGEHELTVAIPEMRFGALRVEVRNPDGRKPPDGRSVWLSGRDLHGSQKIVNGVARFPIVPVGSVTVSCNERDGVIGMPVRGIVAAERETTLGPIVLRTIDEAYGHVTGYVTLADGRPALGAVAGLQDFVSPSAFSDNGRTQVSGTGEFRVSAPPETGFLVVNLMHCDLWPPGSLAEQATAEPGLFAEGLDKLDAFARTRMIAKPVSLTQGQAQSLTVMLPDVPFRDVKIRNGGEHHAHLHVWTDLGEAWMSMEADVAAGQTHTFPFVPDRPTLVMVSTWVQMDREHSRHGGAGILDVPAGDAPMVECDLSRTSALRVKSRSLVAGGDVDGVTVRAAEAPVPKQLATLAGIGEMDRYLDEDGFVTFRLAPGRYIVRGTSHFKDREQTVELAPDSTRDIEFDFSADP